MDIELKTGDITEQDDLDAVVNAANAELAPGGGVAGALHRAAGPGLAEEAAPMAPIEPGEAVITGAHDLPNDYVIHCLGPVYGRDEPSDEQEGVDVTVEPDKGPHPVIAVVHQKDDVALPRALDNGVRNGLELEGEAQAGARQDLPGPVEDDRLGQRSHGGLSSHDLVEQGPVPDQPGGFSVEIIGHGERIGAKDLLMLMQVGSRNGSGFVDRRLDPLAEPGLDADIEEKRRKRCDDDRRHDRQQAEHEDHADVQPRSGHAATPLAP